MKLLLDLKQVQLFIQLKPSTKINKKIHFMPGPLKSSLSKSLKCMYISSEMTEMYFEKIRNTTSKNFVR